MLDTDSFKTFRKKKGVLHTEIITPENVPDWAKNRHQLWNTVEATEKRKDSQLAREIMVALPNELSEAQRLELVRNYITEQFTTQGIIADLAIHAPNRHGDNRNYHAHILLTMRKITAAGFGNKERAWNAKANIYQWREQWQHHTNQALKQAGLDHQIDGRSHAKKGLDKEPLLHLGVHATALERRGIQTELGNENREIEKHNELRKTLHRELDQVNSEIALLDAEFNEVNDRAVLERDDAFNLLDKQNYLIAELLNNLNTMKHESLLIRKPFITECAKTFNDYDSQMEVYIANIAEQKTQDRLALQAKLNQARFTQLYNTQLAGVLVEEDKTANAHEISQLGYLATRARSEYDEYLKQWAIKAVRDDDYDYRCLDEKIVAMVERIKKAEQKYWVRFNDRVKTNGWSDGKIAKQQQQQQHLVQVLDSELASHFGLDRGFAFER